MSVATTLTTSQIPKRRKQYCIRKKKVDRIVKKNPNLSYKLLHKRWTFESCYCQIGRSNTITIFCSQTGQKGNLSWRSVSFGFMWKRIAPNISIMTEQALLVENFTIWLKASELKSSFRAKGETANFCHMAFMKRHGYEYCFATHTVQRDPNHKIA